MLRTRVLSGSEVCNRWRHSCCEDRTTRRSSGFVNLMRGTVGCYCAAPRKFEMLGELELQSTVMPLLESWSRFES